MLRRRHSALCFGALAALLAGCLSAGDSAQDGGADTTSDAARDVPSIFQDRAADEADEGGGDGGGLGESELCRSLEEDYPPRASTAVVGGNVGQCVPGALTPDALDDIVRRVNWYRGFYDIPPVPAPLEDVNADEQACALMMAAEGDLDHFPGTDWACYTEAGAGAAGASNLSLGGGRPEDHIDGLIVDTGNFDTLGHRRWILYPAQAGHGYGFIAGALCQHVFGTQPVSAAQAAAPIAYPPAGAFPVDLMFPGTAWSVSWSGANFRDADLILEDDATDAAIPLDQDLTHLPDGFGDNTAIFIPGRAPTDGDRWRVRIEGIERNGSPEPPLVYTIDFVTCP